MTPTWGSVSCLPICYTDRKIGNWRYSLIEVLRKSYRLSSKKRIILNLKKVTGTWKPIPDKHLGKWRLEKIIANMFNWGNYIFALPPLYQDNLFAPRHNFKSMLPHRLLIKSKRGPESVKIYTVLREGKKSMFPILAFSLPHPLYSLYTLRRSLSSCALYHSPHHISPSVTPIILINIGQLI